MIAFLTSWMTWLAVARASGPLLIKFLPVTAPIFAVVIQSKAGRTVIYGLLIAAVALLVVSALESRAYNRGAADTQQKVNDQNRRAVERANEASISVEDCYDRGGDWIQERGVCTLP